MNYKSLIKFLGIITIYSIIMFPLASLGLVMGYFIPLPLPLGYFPPFELIGIIFGACWLFSLLIYCSLIAVVSENFKDFRD